MAGPGITLASPPDVFPVAAYEHASVAGGFIHIAGQVARDENGDWVGGDDAGAQAAQIYRNIGRILAHVGAGPGNVVRIMVYIVSHENWEGATRAREAFFGDHRPPHPYHLACRDRPGYGQDRAAGPCELRRRGCRGASRFLGPWRGAGGAAGKHDRRRAGA